MSTQITQLFLVKNECYIVGRKRTPRGIMVHSTGANNPNLRRYVGPDDGILGHNPNNNHWNIFHPGGRDIGPHPFKRNPDTGRCATCGGRQVCVNAFIGKDKNGAVRIYQTLPWDMRSWHAGHVAGNDTHIGFEICEDGLSDRAYFNEVYAKAADLCVHLCRQYNLSPNTIIGHFEGHRQGIASNHADPGHWFPRHGKSMDTFRADVKAAMSTPAAPSPTNPPKGDDTVSIPKDPGPGYLLYLVKPGDRLGTIAARYGTTWQNLQQINGIPDPNRIEPGDLYWVPVPTAPGTPAAPAPDPAALKALQDEIAALKTQVATLTRQRSQFEDLNRKLTSDLKEYEQHFEFIKRKVK